LLIRTRLPKLLVELTVFKDEEWLKMKKRYLTCDLLILDDWLLEKVGGEGARELLEIIEGRLRTGSLLVCSQFSPAGWHAKLGEGAIADAVIDRIVYRSDIIHIEGDESMRKRIG
jgi:DNA replication protein DnaC